MADNNILNLSLDDIIKQKSSRTRKGQSKEDSKNSRPGGKRFTQGLRVTVANSGAKRVAGGYGRRSTQVPSVQPLEDVPRNQEALEGNATWEHDLYEGGPASRAKRIRPARNGFKLLITNLDFKVTDDDIQELFENCGPLVKASVLYDRSGRSEESAEVIFQNRADALAAQKRYNNLALDSKPMKIELVEDSGAGAAGRILSSGIRLGNTQRSLQSTGALLQGQRRADRSGGRPYQSRNRADAPRLPAKARGRGSAISQDDLDRDLDSYMATD